MDHPKETSAFPSNATEVKVPQVACSVSTTNAEIGKKEHKKKRRSKNKKAYQFHQFTQGETGKPEEKNDIHRNEDAEDRESSTPEKQVLEEKQKELSTFWFKLVPQGDKKGPRLPPLNKPHIRLKDSRITVSVIQKYIAQKLNMNDHTEVDVVCCGEKLNGDMTLKDIQLIWMSHLPNSGREKVKWDLEEAVIELGYVRSQKLETPPRK